MLIIDIQFAQTDSLHSPDAQQFQQWAEAAYQKQRLRKHIDESLVTIRIVDVSESQFLNREYRGKDQPTNVLSFPMQMPAGIEPQILGDIVICSDVVLAEATKQDKRLEHHWAHMVIHGILHLCGYDHQEDIEAEAMEALETMIMVDLGLPDPYI